MKVIIRSQQMYKDDLSQSRAITKIQELENRISRLQTELTSKKNRDNISNSPMKMRLEQLMDENIQLSKLAQEQNELYERTKLELVTMRNMNSANKGYDQELVRLNQLLSQKEQEITALKLVKSDSQQSDLKLSQHHSSQVKQLQEQLAQEKRKNNALESELMMVSSEHEKHKQGLENDLYEQQKVHQNIEDQWKLQFSQKTQEIASINDHLLLYKQDNANLSQRLSEFELTLAQQANQNKQFDTKFIKLNNDYNAQSQSLQNKTKELMQLEYSNKELQMQLQQFQSNENQLKLKTQNDLTIMQMQLQDQNLLKDELRKLQEISQLYDQVKQENQQLKVQLTDYEKLMSSNEELKREFQNQMSNEEQLTRELNSYGQKYEHLMKEYEIIVEANEQNKIQIAKLKQESNFNKSEASFAKKEIERLKKEKDLLSENAEHLSRTLESQLNDLHEKYNMRETDLTNLQNDNSSFKNQNIQLKNQISIFEQEWNKLSNVYKDQVKNGQNMDAELREKEDKLHNLNAQFSQLQRQYENLQQDYGKLQCNHNDLQQIHLLEREQFAELQQNFEGHVESLSMQVSSLEEQVKAQEDENLSREQDVMVSLNQLTVSKRELGERLEKREKDFNILKEDHHKLKYFCEQLQKENSELNASKEISSQLGSENQKIKEEHLRAICKLQSKESDLVGKNSEIEELKRGIDLRNTEIESWQKHVVDLKKELLQVKRENQRKVDMERTSFLGSGPMVLKSKSANKEIEFENDVLRQEIQRLVVVINDLTGELDMVKGKQLTLNDRLQMAQIENLKGQLKFSDRKSDTVSKRQQKFDQ